MAGIAYRSVTAGGTVNWSAPATWQVYANASNIPIVGTGGTWSAGTWIAVTASTTPAAYPGDGDYVWPQGTTIILYDTTIIAASNLPSFTAFAQISARASAWGIAVGQPLGGTAGSDLATNGYISLTVAPSSGTVINFKSLIYAPYNNSTNNGLIYANIAGGITFNFEGNPIPAAAGGFIRTGTLAGMIINCNFGSNTLSSGTGAGTQAIYHDSANSTLTVTAANITPNAVTAISLATTGITVNIYGNINGSSGTSNAYGIATSNTTNTNTINLYGDALAGNASPAISAFATSTGNNVVNIMAGAVRTIRNYGPAPSYTNSFMAILANQLVTRTDTVIQYKTSDGSPAIQDFKTSTTNVTVAAAVWGALLSDPAFSTSGSIGDKLKSWQLGTDNKVLLSNNSQTGVTIPTVTTVGSVSGSVNSVVNSVGSIAASGITTNSFATGAIKNTSFASGAIDATALATDAVNEIATAIWDYLTSNATTSNSLGLLIKTNLDTTVSSRASASNLTTAQTDITAIKTKTDNLPANTTTELTTIQTNTTDIPNLVAQVIGNIVANLT